MYFILSEMEILFLDFFLRGKKTKMSTETANQGIHCNIYSSEELNLMLNNGGVIKYT